MATGPTKTARREGEPRATMGWRITVVEGPDKGTSFERAAGLVTIGSASTNDLVLADGKVSRRHLEVALGPLGVALRDVGSKNGTFYLGSRVETAELPPSGAAVRVGDTEIAFFPLADPAVEILSDRDHLGRLVGQSRPMRRLYAEIERIAPRKSTVLIHGETGTGKELVAEALHDLSGRPRDRFLVVDCGAIPAEIMESELYGHCAGAFTGADRDRRGSFEVADGGTLFLDEVAELPRALQPKLLRVLQSGSIRRVGETRARTVDVRVIAATNRDLHEEVRAGRFREDLFYRLSVMTITVPPLRTRREDIPALAARLLEDLGGPALPPEARAVLAAGAWRGNVRQLRNVLERAVSAGGMRILPEDLEAPEMTYSPSQLLSLPFPEAKRELLARFTKDYLEKLLERHRGNVSAAARESRVNRNWIVALARRHGVRVRE